MYSPAPCVPLHTTTAASPEPAAVRSGVVHTTVPSVSLYDATTVTLPVAPEKRQR